MLLEYFTTSKMDRHLLRQNVRQKISVIKTNTIDDLKKYRKEEIHR